MCIINEFVEKKVLNEWTKKLSNGIYDWNAFFNPSHLLIYKTNLKTCKLIRTNGVMK
jgi:hypothetical protein